MSSYPAPDNEDCHLLDDMMTFFNTKCMKCKRYQDRRIPHTHFCGNPLSISGYNTCLTHGLYLPGRE